jgi:hypothetical protein
MRSTLLRKSALMLGAALAAGCADLRAPVPESDYRAEVLIQLLNPSAPAVPEPTLLAEFYQAGKLRREGEADGETMILLDRPDLRVSWLLRPKMKSFDEYRISSRGAPLPWSPNPFGPRARTRADFELLGPETLDNLQARKYAVRGKTIEGYAWLSPTGIPIRFLGTIERGGKPLRVEIRYSDVETGPQPAWLFAIPPDFAGYEDRKKPPEPNSQMDPETIRRARENLRREQTRGEGPGF